MKKISLQIPLTLLIVLLGLFLNGLYIYKYVHDFYEILNAVIWLFLLSFWTFRLGREYEQSRNEN